MKQNQRELLVSSSVTYQFNCHLTSKKSTKNINDIYKRFLKIILNDYESSYPYLLEKARKMTFH